MWVGGGKKNHSYWNIIGRQGYLFLLRSHSNIIKLCSYTLFLILSLSLSLLPLYVHIVIQMWPTWQGRVWRPDQTFHRGSILLKLRGSDATFFLIFRCKKEIIYSNILTHLLSALGPGILLSLSHCLLSLIYPIINSSLTLIHNYGCFWGNNELLLGLNVYSSNTVSSSILIISTWKEV